MDKSPTIAERIGNVIFKSLAVKLIFSVVLVYFLTIGLYAFLTIKSQRTQMIQEVINGAETLSDTIKRSTKYDMLKYNREGVHKIIETVGEQKGTERVRVFNKEGIIMFSSDKSEIGNMVDKKAEACYACHSAEKPIEKLDTPLRTRIFYSKSDYRILGIINPIYNEKDCYSAACHAHPRSQKVLGVLDVSRSLADIDAQMDANRRRLVFSALGSILGISVIIGVFVQRFAHRPIRILMRGLRSVSSGNLNETISIRTKDEVGELAHAFNQMTHELRLAKEKALEWERTLEKKVEKRTEELRKIQGHLIQTEKLASMGKLAAGVAHEINNPLGGIVALSHLLLEDIETGDARRENIEKIAKESLRCREIVKGLLDFARQTEPRSEPCNVNSIIEETLSLVEKQVIFQYIDVAKSFYPDLPEILLDRMQIQQAFMNIILNAVEAMKGKGELTIVTGLAKDGRFITIQIKDTGPGIPPEILDKIFDPFFTTKEAGKGTGLGLAITYGVIEKHGGRIRVESRVGEGANFIIELPAAG